MSDSTRPAATFLPPQITARILIFLCANMTSDSKDYLQLSSLSRVGPGWQSSSQECLFKAIVIQTSGKLSKLVDSMQFGFGKFIKFLNIFILPQDSTPEDAHLTYQLLTSTPNLLNLAFQPVFSGFDSADEASLRATNFLPKLKTLYIHPTESSNQADWSREVFDPILVTSGNVEELVLATKNEYKGPKWTSGVFHKLKALQLESPELMEGLLWDLSNFTALEMLNLDFERKTPGQNVLKFSTLPFFRTVGKNLQRLSVASVDLTAVHYQLLTKLEYFLSGDTFFMFSENGYLYPPNISQLVIHAFQGANMNISNLNNLKELVLVGLFSSYPFETLPKLKKLEIDSVEVHDLLESTENLIKDQIPFDKLVLGWEGAHWKGEDVDEDIPMLKLCDNEEVKKRCEELGIKLVDIDHEDLNFD